MKKILGIRAYIFALLPFLFPSFVYALEDSVCTKKINPTIINNEVGDSAIGLDFLYKNYFGDMASQCGNKKTSTEGYSVAGEDVILPIDDNSEGGHLIVDGTVSFENDILPKELITIDAGYTWFRMEEENTQLLMFESAEYTAGIKHETDQNFDESITSASFSGIAHVSTISLLLGVDYILSDEDEARKVLVEDDNYVRLRGEITVGKGFKLDKQHFVISWNYRYFKEMDAEDAVVNAGLDKYFISTVKLDFLNSGTYVAYSRGDLPFDHSEGRVFKIGWSHNF